ncbi:hypothetical protein [Chryseobacterium gleum]|uniref:hypothetical protein n=1 Tax=Chryseobacterium gleum TaxID=250 RepID=UPI001E3EB61E|nr:hypothetical protein [Chryseobacterium gleum]MCD9615979.1 hypothetical protein [Chryseobacterium gleum]
MERVQINKIAVEDIIQLLKTDDVDITVEEAKMVLLFLYLLADLVTREQFNFEIMPVD